MNHFSSALWSSGCVVSQLFIHSKIQCAVCLSLKFSSPVTLAWYLEGEEYYIGFHFKRGGGGWVGGGGGGGGGGSLQASIH